MVEPYSTKGLSCPPRPRVFTRRYQVLLGLRSVNMAARAVPLEKAVFSVKPSSMAASARYHELAELLPAPHCTLTLVTHTPARPTPCGLSGGVAEETTAE